MSARGLNNGHARPSGRSANYGANAAKTRHPALHTVMELIVGILSRFPCANRAGTTKPTSRPQDSCPLSRRTTHEIRSKASVNCRMNTAGSDCQMLLVAIIPGFPSPQATARRNEEILSIASVDAMCRATPTTLSLYCTPQPKNICPRTAPVESRPCSQRGSTHAVDELSLRHLHCQ